MFDYRDVLLNFSQKKSFLQIFPLISTIEAEEDRVKESPASEESASAHGHGSASHGKPASSLPRDNRKFALLFHLSLPLCPGRSEQTLSVLVCLI